ncbi:hypothetical protein BCR34DRAFT_605215 [Clohesyomyces aquaticus]|uniref:Uncharacterized protein n=1 Tax=Clohesyomyces aquaticus TaxID=1231657 RepID=A0A1Y1Z0L5_9PLEO|nr:hypothetical protein BCR34DRAFT_605215 [Clohesyomyces aquaticus]
MAYNGTLVALFRASWTAAFADARPLRTTYIGIPSLDFAISVLVAFFDNIVDREDEGAWLLIFNFEVVLQVATLWVMVEGSRKGQNERKISLYFLWPLLWNLFGAAVAFPLYLGFHTRSTAARRLNPAISKARSNSLIPILFAICFFPVMAMHYAYRLTTDSNRQALIVICQFSPLILGLLGAVIPREVSEESHVNKRDGDVDAIRYSYFLAGLISGGVYLYLLSTTVLSGDPSVGFARVFVPSPSSVIMGHVEIIRQGALLFLQYDWIIFNLACALWIFLILDNHQILLGNTKSWLKRSLLVFGSLLLLGPGGTVCGVLWLRETHLRNEFMGQDRQ